MATTPSTSQAAAGDADIFYPTRDGRPIGETPIHRDNLFKLVDVLKQRFADDPNVYVSGNMMMYYVEGDPRKQLSPDVFVTFGIPKDTPRDIYCIWREGGRAPDLVIELTSKSTRKEDQVKKFSLYQDVLKVREYFLFDPRGDYLKPRLKGFRLQEEVYAPIAEAGGRLPSDALGLHFEADGQELQLYDPAVGEWLPTEAEAERQQRIEEQQRRIEEQQRRIQAEREVERLQREIEALRRQRSVDDAGNGA